MRMGLIHTPRAFVEQNSLRSYHVVIQEIPAQARSGAPVALLIKGNVADVVDMK